MRLMGRGNERPGELDSGGRARAAQARRCEHSERGSRAKPWVHADPLAGRGNACRCGYTARRARRAGGISIPARRGIALAAVLTAIVVALFLWAVGYQRFSSLINVEARLEAGSAGIGFLDLGSALGRVVACLKIAIPPSSPYSCQLSLGSGSNQAQFTVQYVSQGAGRWRVVVSPGANPVNPVCPSCPTAAGP